MKPIIKKVIALTKKNGGEIAWNDIPANTRKYFLKELRSQFDFTLNGKPIKSSQLTKFKVI